MKKARIIFSFKVAVSILLIWLVLEKSGIGRTIDRLADLSPTTVAAVLLVVWLQIALSAVRWRLVAGCLDSPPPLPVLLRAVPTAFFFNQTLPSTVGGDAYRILAARRVTASTALAVNGVIWDRVSGLAVLLVIIILTLPMLAAIAPAVLPWTLAGLAIAGLAGLAVVVGAAPWLDRMLSARPLIRPLASFVSAGHGVMTGGGRFAGILLVALAGWLLTVLNVLLIATGLAVPLGFLDCLILVPPVVLLVAVPVSIAGWGLREGGLMMTLGLVGVAAPDAVAISISMGLLLALAGLPGGILWLFDRPGK
jgi:hypothetical protein